MPKTKPAYELHRSSGVAGIVAEGHYQRCEKPDGTPYWVLREWRLIVDGDEGTWHRVHGNRKKDFGNLKLLRDTPPMAVSMPRKKITGPIEV